MKTKAIYLTLIMLLAFSTVAMASVTPTLMDPWQSGNAKSECAQAGEYMYAFKIDGWGEVDEFGVKDFKNGTYDAVFEDLINKITILNSNGILFDWSATHSIGAVIVKGGPLANVFYYDPQSKSDQGLYSPVNPKNNKNYAVSHVTFCWNPEPEICEWVGETAWAAGTRYVEQGNWATFTPYEADSTVNLYAGQTMLAGSVHFSAPVDGNVTITVNLASGWRAKDVAEVLKVQDYTVAPSGNPNPGGFEFKTGELSVVVPANNYYGVHVDVEWEKCD